MPCSNRQKLAAIKREISYRKYVYGKRVASGAMMQEQADYQLKVFEEIAGDYEDLVLGDEIKEEAEKVRERLV